MKYMISRKELPPHTKTPKIEIETPSPSKIGG
jgi:hypothetical protein